MNSLIKEKLVDIYGAQLGKKISYRCQKLLHHWRKLIPDIPGAPQGGMSTDERDAILITYADNLQKSGEIPLATLEAFSRKRLSSILSGIHILPFSPYSSDDGFSVINYREINPEWGSWKNISKLSKHFRLMADLVLNHCSVQSNWFKDFLRGEKKYADFFITVDPDTDLSAVFRPRALPLLHEFTVKDEKKLVWTTFSADQVDLNFANPSVLLEFLDILLDYISKGVRMFRLDAVGFLWKEIGSSCIHHPKTHAVVQLFRLVLDFMAPGTILITETNVPHQENISYFGDGKNEAQMVYQFSLPPLTLDALIRGDSSKLSHWASHLPAPNPHHTFFNFLASHDGIGLLPTKGYLDEKELNSLIKEVQNRGGLVSYKATAQGKIPYELNVSYLDAVAELSLSTEQRAQKFLASQAIMLCLAGVPGIYIHSLLGSGNWKEGPDLTSISRSINREKLSCDAVETELDTASSLRHHIFNGYARLLKARRAHPAFHPAADQEILSLGTAVFALIRQASDGRRVLCLQSVSKSHQKLSLPQDFSHTSSLYDLLNDLDVNIQDAQVELEPWEVLWLEKR